MASSGKAYTLMYLFLLWLIYLTIGVFIFKAVEHDGDKEPENTKEELLEKVQLDVTAQYNMSKTDFDSLVQKIEEASSSSSNARPEWSLTQSLSFVVQLVTTIGKLVNSKTVIVILSFSKSDLHFLPYISIMYFDLDNVDIWSHHSTSFCLTFADFQSQFVCISFRF